MHRWLDHIADEFPGRDFIVTDARDYSYREMQRWSCDLARGLAARGLGKGDHVAVLMANHPEYVALKFAISRLGAVIIPININYQRDELRFILTDSEAKALVVMTGFGARDYLGLLDDMAPGWDGASRPADLSNLGFIAQFETTVPARDGVPTLSELACGGGEDPDVPVGGDDPSVIFYTSGTTGSPKGVIWSHDAETRIAYGAALTRAFGDGWRVQAALPLFHVMANNEALHAAMFVGGAYIPRLRFDVADFVTAIQRHRPTEIVTVPTMTVALCESDEAAAADTSSLVALMCAGANAPAWLWERAAEALGVQEMTTAYGMTETGGAPAAARPELGVEHVSTTVGQVRMGGVAAAPDMNGLLAEVATVDPDTGERLPEGAEGELISRGPTNAIGYWKRPEATAETFRDGWVFTGDLARILADGSIVLTGRKKEMIRSGGENFAPKEVEDLLTRHPAVSQAYVVGVPDVKWGESCCAWIVREPHTEVSAEELIEFCRDKLAAFKRPRQVLFLAAEDLPKTPTGKVQKFVLVEMAVQATAGAG